MAIIDGTSGNDTLNGTSGDDTLTGFAGNDTLNGGDGTDKAVFSGAAADYLILHDALTGTFTVVDKEPSVNGDDGTDVLTDIETLEFSDLNIDLTGGSLPLAADSIIQVPKGGQALHFLTGVGGTDEDQDQTVELTYAIVDATASTDTTNHPPANGWFETAKGYIRIIDATTGAYEFDAKSGETGTDSFSFRMTDERGISSETEVDVTIGRFSIEHAVSFGGTDSDYLSGSMTSVIAEQKTWSLSFWIQQPETLSTNAYAVMSGYHPSVSGLSDTNYIDVRFEGSESNVKLTTGTTSLRQSSASYAGSETWMHVLAVVDTTQSDPAARHRLYIDGQEVPYSVEANLAQDALTAFGTANGFVIGKSTAVANHSEDFNLAEMHFVAGSALVPSSFGLVDPTTGKWQPVEYSGGHGTNGFYLNFSDENDLGADASGNANDLTVHGTIMQIDATPTDEPVVGTAGNDYLEGDDDNDALDGDSGDDKLIGGAGNDTLNGGADDDILAGGGGADYLIGGDGNDVLRGDAVEGVDPSAYEDGEEFDQLAARGIYAAGTAFNGEIIITGHPSDNSIKVIGAEGPPPSDAAEQIARNGTTGETETVALRFDDLMSSATVYFTNLVTTEEGGERGQVEAYRDGVLVGMEVFDSTDVTDPLSLGITGSGSIDISVTGGFDKLVFTPLETEDEVTDSNNANANDDSSDFFIHRVDTTALDTAGNDLLDGGAGDDQLFGGAGDDDLIGGLGQDVMEGGAGSDVFIYQSVADSGIGALLRDVIQDFDAGTSTTAVDTLDISAIVSGTFDFLGAESETFNGNGDTEARFNSATKILEIDADGDTEVDMEIELKDVDIANLDDSDFVVS